MKRFTVIFAGIIILVGVWILFKTNESGPDAIQPSGLEYEVFKEFAKLYMQFLFVSIAGFILVQKYNQGMQERADNKALIKATEDALFRIYCQTKKVRSDLRYERSEINSLGKDKYEKAIQGIKGLKSELETIVHQVYLESKTFGRFNPTLSVHLKAMQNYLKNILREYEHKRALLLKDTPTINLSDFDAMNKFLYRLSTEDKEKKIQTEFIEKYKCNFRNLQKVLRKENTNAGNKPDFVEKIQVPFSQIFNKK